MSEDQHLNKHVVWFQLSSNCSCSDMNVTLHLEPDSLKAEYYQGLCDAWLLFGYVPEKVMHRRHDETQYEDVNTFELFPPEWDRA